MGIVSAQAAEQDQNMALFAPLSSLPLPEEKVKRLAQAVEGGRVIDLLFHLPERYQDRRNSNPREGEVATLPVRAHRVCPPRGPSQPWVVQCESPAGALDLIYFGRQRWLGAWLERHFPEGAERRVSGKMKLFRDRWQMDAPDYISPPDVIPGVQPVWPLVKGLGQKDVAKGMTAALGSLPVLPEWHGGALMDRRRWPSFDEALCLLQAPSEPPEDTPRDRLAYDELLAGQIAIGLVRRTVMRRPGRRLVGDGHLRQAALAAFGFPPTPAQVSALAEIDADLAAPTRMLRLLQGDVGAGKTLVALLAMLRAVEAGTQAALMAPTELLARQHLRTFQKLAGAAGVECVLLAGSVKGKERKRVLAGLADGSIPLVVGTHALIEEGVVFQDLGLVVVDEQHRFGVSQRLALTEKGTTDVLVMTATPIPRTLLLTQWGEMATSRLASRPAGRQPIVTRIISRDRREELTARLRAAFAQGHRAYWVVRAVEEGERHDNVAAETTFTELAAIFGDKVRLAHGAQKLDVREAALQDFAAGRAQLLVATTVVEVGVDVPEATIMIIEQAERFGLAALHQLRGRVGRGSAQSFCLLLPSAELNESEQRRLAVLRDTEDGFVIADADLEYRGGGDALGVRQAGHIGRRLVDPQRHGGLIKMAHKDAELLLQKDPGLSSPRGQAARLLLQIFGHDLTLAPLAAG
ncbi:ATP-dependent DNA helicase RecG [Pseudoroseomonas wenyumeiae]|uniref:ATP-dependent DNA helicase RecG n=1 Tax=Teichococcus wenyumeiae TaxID=2478470 RepID=A0A3A9JEE4_9PROT|nr:ATP-dependent DNA helicase RecG [Pseudoroseomonas wenyumeiae]RKK04922.1 ATP-dependent DNA helicase RecG [Pseudoroseomonas wenyumeiae]RMI26153.1 ATP-dependent DNA helicase RecG [Pseudoroseomonas wenyumeiae]